MGASGNRMRKTLSSRVQAAKVSIVELIESAVASTGDRSSRTNARWL